MVNFHAHKINFPSEPRKKILKRIRWKKFWLYDIFQEKIKPVEISLVSQIFISNSLQLKNTSYFERNVWNKKIDAILDPKQQILKAKFSTYELHNFFHQKPSKPKVIRIKLHNKKTLWS